MLNEETIGKFRGARVGVVLGGDSDERDVSIKTGTALARALESCDYDVTVYDVPRDLQKLAAERPAAVLLGLHGGDGENGVFQGFLETLDIPYSGSGVLASAVAMDKGRAKALFRSADVPTPRALSLHADDFRALDSTAYAATVGLPLVAKVNDGGSSCGVYLCKTEEELSAALEALAPVAGRGVLLEEYIAGDEYTVGFFDDDFLGAINVRAANAFYDFEAKYSSNETRYVPVADADLLGRLEAVGRRAYQTLGCRGVARIDVMARGAELFVIEANTIPGMTETSLVPKMARALGLSFAQFAERMLDAATTDARHRNTKR